MSKPEPNVPMREEFPSNSHTEKEEKSKERPKNEVVAKATIRKSNPLKQTAKAIFVEDASSVGMFVLSQVVLPSLKQLIYDIGVGGLGRALFNDGVPNRKGGSTGRIGFTDYNSASRRRADLDPAVRSERTMSKGARSNFDFTELVWPDRASALNVIIKLRDILDFYGVVSVADLYEISEISASYTDKNWGWNELEQLRDATVSATRDGFIINIAEPISLQG